MADHELRLVLTDGGITGEVVCLADSGDPQRSCSYLAMGVYPYTSDSACFVVDSTRDLLVEEMLGQFPDLALPGIPVRWDVERGDPDYALVGPVGRPVPDQHDVLEWVRRRWPDRTTPIWRAAKLCEEAGETMGAVIKVDEGRKTKADIAQETAQTVICCLGLAESVGFDLLREVDDEWARCNPLQAEVAGG